MKKVYCELHMFDLTQKIYVIDTETNQCEFITVSTMDRLPEMICAICNDDRNIKSVVIKGNTTFSSNIAENILSYSKEYYNYNEIKVEVIE